MQQGRGVSLSLFSARRRWMAHVWTLDREFQEKPGKKKNWGLTFAPLSAILSKSAAPTTRCGGIAQLGERNVLKHTPI